MRALAILAAIFAFPAAAAAGPGDGFQVERYTVALRPDLASKAVSGREAILVEATSERVTQLSFSANALRISEATLDGTPVAVTSDKDRIVFTLRRALPKGAKALLRFRFEGVPARGVTVADRAIYTGYFACDWMVCLQDSPGDKAQFDLDLILPGGLQTIAVGRALPRRRSGASEVHRWRSTRPYSPYLYAFAAGPLERRSVPTAEGELVYLDATGTHADLDRLFGQSPNIAAFLADKAGMTLPDRSYAQLLVPRTEAQETANFSLIGRAELDAEREAPSQAWVIAHEMAHQWWGNLVTCATWQDFWLQEGLATFMVAAWQEQASGPAAYRAHLDAARRRVERARAIGFDKPLAWPGKYPSLGARRAVQYSKGALFLAHLREEIGDPPFWSGLRRFTRQHAGGTVTSRDFQAAMEQAAGRDLSAEFNAWVYGAER